eukprot:TRINITY_DN4844_c0_g1_i1.p1 TRINITY_DN4844_c0_g1~~TRINITY_DN4844_c0_g1_i1.p1  ORF type:complete len:911 (+),score=229.13 TRINITY_DN4844_c0_g1_i1:58-2790(+)
MSHFLRATLPKKQIQLVDEVLGAYDGDELVHHASLEAYLTNDITRKTKPTPTLIVLSKYRIFVFSKGKTLEKDFPLLFLTRIHGKGSKVTFSFHSPQKHYLVITSKEDTTELVHQIYHSYSKLTYGWPKSKVCSFEYSVDSFSSLSWDTETDGGPAKGFITTYSAFCNAMNSPIRTDFIAFIKELDEEEITDLKLSECPGLQPRSPNPLDLRPLAFALRHNSYFKSLEARDIDNKDIFMFFGTILKTNTTLTKVVCANCNITEIPEYYGSALSQNPDHQIQIIQFSSLKLTPKCCELFGKTLLTYKHALNVLDLSGSLGASGILPVLEGMKANWAFTLSLQQLSLAHNPMSENAANELASILSNMKKSGALKRLSLANVGGLTVSLLAELSNLKLSFLDLSGNKFDNTKTSSALISYCEAVSSPSLDTLGLASCALSPEILSRMLKGIFQNEPQQLYSFDVSANFVGSGLHLITPLLKEKTARFHTLDLSDNNIKEKACMELLKNLNYIRKLVLDKNCPEKPESEGLAVALGSFLVSHPELHSLSIAHMKLGKTLSHFFGYLNKNSTLEELDITGNGCGNSAFNTLAHYIRTTNIRSLRCDGNGISYPNYLNFRISVKYNKNFRHLQFPINDIDQEKDPKARQVFSELLVDIVAENRYKKKKEVPVWNASVFDFDMKWPTPNTDPVVLPNVPTDGNVATSSPINHHLSQASLPEEVTNWFFSSLSPRTKKLPTLNSARVMSDKEEAENSEMVNEGDEPTRRKLKRRYSEGGSRKIAEKRENYFRMKSEKAIQKQIKQSKKLDSSSARTPEVPVKKAVPISASLDSAMDKQHTPTIPKVGSSSKVPAITETSGRTSPRKKSGSTPQKSRWRDSPKGPRSNSPGPARSLRHKRIASHKDKETEPSLIEDNNT